MGNFFGVKLVRKDNVDKLECNDVPVVVSAVSVPSQIALPKDGAAEQPSGVSGRVDVKDALQSKLSVLGNMFGGQQITLDKNIHDMATNDEHIGMKTEIRDPASFSVWELVGGLALDRGYLKTAETFKKFAMYSKVNMVSLDRKGRKELKEIYASRQGVEDQVGEGDGSVKDKLFGKRVQR